MVSSKLLKIIGVSIPLFVAHGLEEYFTGFYLNDPIFKFALILFQGMGFNQGMFLLLQIMILLILVISFTILSKKYWIFLTLLGLTFVVESHHIIHAVLIRGYYPGLVTSIPLVFLGFLLGKELIKQQGLG